MMLEDGFVAHGSGLVWHQQELRGMQRLFFNAFATGRPIVGGWTSSGLMTSRRAMKCSACGTVVLPRIADRQGR